MVMTLSEELLARGFVHQFTTSELADLLDQAPRVVYHGFDPTADSIHVGNFVQWMLLRHLADRGFTIVLLVGGGTGRIGDPKPDVERPLLTDEEVNERVTKMTAQARHLLGRVDLTVVDNYEWLGKLSLLEFLRDTGKHFTVNELIKKDAIARRLESEIGLSYTEFAYPLLQGYDYLTLYRTYNCTLQTGGSDQWGNMVAGVDLIRRVEGGEAHVLTTPLIIDKATGKKFGKSEGNAVWLDPNKTTPFQFYQFWLNASDESVVDYLKLYTLLPLSEIDEIARVFTANPGERLAQRRLAYEVTVLVHGDEVAHSVERVSETLFGQHPLVELSAAEFELLTTTAPFYRISSSTPLVDVVVETKLATSKREARTFLTSGAISINGTKVADDTTSLSSYGTRFLLKRGRRQVAVVEVE